MPDSNSTRNTPLPPSVEKAYWRKCIDLKKRINEIEESNDNARLRVRRIDRSIRKMRIERAFLLERLAKTQNLALDESEHESSPEPEPPERPIRARRSHGATNHAEPGPDEPQAPTLPLAAPAPPQVPAQAPAAVPPPDGPLPHHAYPQAMAPQYPPQHGPPAPMHVPPPAGHSPPGPPAYQSQPGYPLPPQSNLPAIHQLPAGTSVILNPNTGRPKGPPWVLTDLDPRHHFQASFDARSRAEQVEYLRGGYRPITEYGHAIPVFEELAGDRRFRHGSYNQTTPPMGCVLVNFALYGDGPGPAPPMAPQPQQQQPPPPPPQQMDIDREASGHAAPPSHPSQVSPINRDRDREHDRDGRVGNGVLTGSYPGPGR